jgi:uncharacterized protein YdaU (DUF1376 family)
MSKSTLYFRHDCNARADRKMVRLAIQHGLAGIGIYWCIVEMLYEEGGYIPLEYERIAFELRSNNETIKSVIHDFDLFDYDTNQFWSKRVIDELNARCEKSDKARQAIETRWSYERNTPVIHSNTKRNTKENRIEENRINISFDVFWDAYQRKQGSKRDCEKRWVKLSDKDRQRIIDTLPSFFKSISDPKYYPYPTTYLNQRRWEDEPIISTPSIPQPDPAMIFDPKSYLIPNWQPPK